jgi:hypothetical protein
MPHGKAGAHLTSRLFGGSPQNVLAQELCLLHSRDGVHRLVSNRDSMEDTMNEDSAIRTARESFDKTFATGTEAVRGVQEGFTSALENVRDLNVRLINIARANSNAAFDFAREVAEAEAPSDLVQAWSTHATKQFDMLTKQASELSTLGQQFAATSSEPITRRAGPASKRQ